MPAKRTTAKKTTRRRVYRRRTVTYTGYGDYRKKGPYYSKYAKRFGQVGSALGGQFGGPAGAMIGKVAGKGLAHGIKYLTGFGDYTVKSNTLVYGQPPNVVNSARPGGSVVISHKEYIGDIYNTSDQVNPGEFKIQKFPIQPGDSQTFPWLSQIAPNFQEYEFRGLLFHFRSMSADSMSSTNTALGSVIMATQYDSEQPDFTSKSQMENYQFTNSIKPSESCLHMIECARASNVLTNLYTRGDDVPLGKDSRFYDLGNFFIATAGMQTQNINLGELWVTYEIELMKPKIFDSQGADIQFFSFCNDVVNPAGATGATAAGFSTSNLWGNNVPQGGPDGRDSYIFFQENTMNLVKFESPHPYDQALIFEGQSIPTTLMMDLAWFGSAAGTSGLMYPSIDFALSKGITQGPPILLGADGAWNWERRIPNAPSITESSLIGRYVVNTTGNGVPVRISFTSDAVLPNNTTKFQINITQIPLIETDSQYPPPLGMR